MLEQFLLETDTLPESMLDLGTGSGILAIAACRMGIKKVTGLDIEAEAVAKVERNCELNGLSGRIIGHVGQPSFLKKPAPLVISNMLLSELLDIRLGLIRMSSPGGTLICSGLFGKQEEELRNSLTEISFVFRALSDRETEIRFSFNVLVKKADVINHKRQSGLIVCCLFICWSCRSHLTFEYSMVLSGVVP